MIIDNVIFIPAIANDSNYYVIDGEILVDTGTGQFTDYLYSKLEENEIKIDDINLIVNTHCHYDHVGGNKDFPDAKVAIGEHDAKYLLNNDEFNTCQSLFCTSIKRRDVDISLKDGDKIANFEVIHTPGHSTGGICLWDGKTLISGDTVFTYGGVGRTDIGGNISDLRDSVNKLKKLDVVNLLPGHGGIAIGDGRDHINPSF